MTNYMGMYNERFMKRAPQYGANAQARTYQDYMRNIQAQRMAAGQTFGNLAMQQQNQSFYDLAMGRPPGLSGGMAQQFSNRMGAARSRQLGQQAQQRYQAFSDIAAQEAQASQFARAEAMADQQFQAQELQFNAQKQAQAQQIMASPNLTFEQKQDRLSNLGLTQGQIERMSPSAGSAAIGGITTAVIGPAVGIKAVSSYRDNTQIQAFQKALSTDGKLGNLVQDQTALSEALGKNVTNRGGTVEVKLANGQTKNYTKEVIREKLAGVEKGIVERKQKVVDQIVQGKGRNPLATFEKTQKQMQAAVDKTTSKLDAFAKKNDLLNNGVIDQRKVNDLADPLKDKYKTLTKAKETAINNLDDAVAGKIKGDAAGVQIASKKKLATLGTKAIKAKSSLAGFSGLLKFAGNAFLVYMILEGGSMALTGTGALEGVGNLLSGKGYRTQGKKGLLDLGTT